MTTARAHARAGAAIAPDAVAEAAERIRDGIARTPSAVSRTLSALLGATIVLKFEGFQFTASYKERGALNWLLQLDRPGRARGVVAMSTGNHAQALAYHATRLGIPCTIVMPTTTPFMKIARTKVLGATVLLEGQTLADALAVAQSIAADEGLAFVHPYDDPAIVAGQGTVCLELLEDHLDLEVLAVPVGGGGLLAGCALAASARRPSRLELVGVESATYASMSSALSGSPALVGGPTVAEGIAVAEPGTLTKPIIETLGADVLVVTEESIERAIALLLEIEKVVAEGAGAAGLAAILEHPDRFHGRTVGVVLTGANIDPRSLASVIMRGLVRDGRLARLRIEIPDLPGALGSVAAVIGAAGANIVELQHERLVTHVPARVVQLDVTIETVDGQGRAAVMDALESAGYAVTLDERRDIHDRRGGSR